MTGRGWWDGSTPCDFGERRAGVGRGESSFGIDLWWRRPRSAPGARAATEVGTREYRQSRTGGGGGPRRPLSLGSFFFCVVVVVVVVFPLPRRTRHWWWCGVKVAGPHGRFGTDGLQVEIWSSIKPIHELFHDWACSNHSISSAFFCTPMSEHCAGSVRMTDSQRECRGRSFSF
ncbi:hypothetical protein BHM03_00055766 [Ensete ventricosum]|nr:hypothetical protein BHM03_00055766 [Ensete ventricosum]